MDKRKVCIWCERWGAGGIESFVVNMLEAMDREGLSIDLLTSRQESDVFDARLSALGICKKVILEKDISSPVIRTFAVFRGLKKVLKAGRYDVIHLNIYHGVALYYAKIAKKAGIPVRIAHSHNAALRPSATRPLKRLAHSLAGRLYAKYATCFLACSGPAADWMFPSGIAAERQVDIITNGVELDCFACKEEDRQAACRTFGLDGRFAVCCVGRLSSQKNQVFLLDVFSEVLKKDPEALLLLAGSDDTGGVVAQKAKALGIEASVRFLGVTDRIPQLLWACDAFVLPSLFEGNPVSGIEAQASGIRCFFSDAITAEAKVAENAEFIPLSAGPDLWAERILTAKNAPRPSVAEQMRRAGYDVKTSAQKLRALYERFA